MGNVFKSIWQYIRNTDLYLLFLALISSSYGVILIYSATRGYDTNKFIVVQTGAILIGVIGFVIVSLIDFENIAPAWKWVFVLNVLFQLALFAVGTAEGGNRSWIRFGPIGIQPAEVGKILFVFTFAQHITLLKDRINHWKNLFQLLIHLGIIAGVIVLSSDDFGMSLAYIFICFFMLFAAGLSLKWFAGGAVLGVASIPFIWNFVLKPYHKTRILVLFDPSINPDKVWQQSQSRIALGAGQMYGEGFMKGNQTQYNMLPAKHTDFIFSVAGEEWGFIGCLVIVGLLALLILRLFYVSFKANDTFSSLLCVGIGGMFMFQTFENIFMCLGIGPVMGLTLPFFSYGGSSIVTMYIAVGIAAGVRMREKPSWLR